MRVRNHGKYTKMSKDNPRAIGRCDYSGLLVSHAGMKDQYQYRGQGLVKTGYRVYSKFLDVPNPQDLSPLIKADPVPIQNARPDNIVEVFVSQTLEVDVSGGSNIDLTQFTQFTDFVFKGVLTDDIVIFVTGTFNDFFTHNITTGGFNLFMQIQNNSASKIQLLNRKMLICNDGYTLHIINSN
jgi:hypothetical protein